MWVAVGLVGFGLVMAALIMVCRSRWGARGAMVPRITRGGRKQEDTAPIIPGEDQTMSQGRGKGDFEFINGYESDS